MEYCVNFTNQLYQYLYHSAHLLMEHYDPCRLEGGHCLAGDPNPCCCKGTVYPREDVNDLQCRYYNDGNCSFPNLGCKLWLCATAIRSADPKCLEALRAIESIARTYDLMEPPYLGEPYCGADNPS